MNYIVITSIQTPTLQLKNMVSKGLEHGLTTVVVGDRKTPNTTWPKGVNFLSIDNQLTMNFHLSSLLPENHYARKNIGYLSAISQGAKIIFDTDDDNEPLQSWCLRELYTSAKPCSQAGWINVYKWFTDEHIWPRGLPLESVQSKKSFSVSEQSLISRAPIQQGLANGSPDVDAIWRLTLDKNIIFNEKDSVLLKQGTWCPFNSQSTWWFPDAYPLMYLPSFVSFRMTDIWRSFVAQRCLWAMNYDLVFHGAEMLQERNPHNLLRDFEQEISGYLGNNRIREILENLELSDKPNDAGNNLLLCYESLIDNNLIPEREIRLVKAWLSDISNLTNYS